MGFGLIKILKQKKTPLGWGTSMPGEGLSQVGDYPPGDGVDDQAQGLIVIHDLPGLVPSHSTYRIKNA